MGAEVDARVSVEPPGTIASDTVSLRVVKDQDNRHGDEEDTESSDMDHEDSVILDIINERKHQYQHHRHHHEDVPTGTGHGEDELDIEPCRIVSDQYCLEDDRIAESTAACQHQQSVAGTGLITNSNRNDDFYRDGDLLVVNAIHIPSTDESSTTSTDSSLQQDSGNTSELHDKRLLLVEERSFIIKLVAAAIFINSMFAIGAVVFALFYHRTPLTVTIAPTLRPTLPPTRSPIATGAHTNGEPVTPTPAPMTMAPTTAPIPVDLPTPAEATNLAAALIPLAIVFELLLMGSLGIIYCTWKRRRMSSCDSSTSTTCDNSQEFSFLARCKLHV